MDLPSLPLMMFCVEQSLPPNRACGTPVCLNLIEGSLAVAPSWERAEPCLVMIGHGDQPEGSEVRASNAKGLREGYGNSLSCLGWTVC